jgi:molybdate transport system substrate-binding protein
LPFVSRQQKETAMKIYVVIAALAMALAHGPAGADEIRLLSSTGMRSVLSELLPQFERASGHKVAASFDTANLLGARIKAGEGADLAILTAPAIDELIGLGKLAPGSRADLARSGMGVSVRAGARKPDIGSVEAFKRALLDAKSVTYTATGASGIYFSGLIERLGIAEQVRAKARTPSGGAVGELVARGEAELAVQQIPELMAVAGTAFVGPLPREIQSFTVFSSGIFADARHAAAARALVESLSAPAAARVMQAKGMEPR